MSNFSLNRVNSMSFLRPLHVVLFTTTLLFPQLENKPVQAQLSKFCQLPNSAVKQKENLLASALTGNQEAKQRYQKLLKQHARQLQECRRRNWPQIQAIWLRLYPCDTRPGAIEQIMDRIVSKGYNKVYLETFYDGRVLLPSSNNPTVWPSVVRNKGKEKVDLLAEAIKKGQQRGLKVYAWMFTTNFGYTYSQLQNRQKAIARNGKGQTSLDVVSDGSQLFIDPYNLDAKRDYYRMVLEVMRRRPDGILFDYIRYPRQTGANSIATKVQDLWLYSEATQKALFGRAENAKGLDLIRRFLSKGYISAGDIEQVDRTHTQEGEPMWQGRIPSGEKSLLSASERQPLLQWELWQLSVAHVMQGIIDFATLASYPAKQQGVPAGVVFFPGGNARLGRGYDSRLQPWDRFPSSLEWHPMLYANCGTTSCIVKQAQRILNTAKPQTKVIPALAGDWGKRIRNRPSLESQMQALRPFAFKIKGVSHFAYSWQHPEHDRQRKSCRMR